MLYKVNKTKNDAIQFLNLVEKEIQVEKQKKENLKLILEELIMNSLHHSSKNNMPLEIEIDINELSVDIEFHEYSESFNILEYYNKNSCVQDRIENFEEGGLGIFLIFKLVKKYDFYYDKFLCKNIMKFKL